MADWEQEKNDGWEDVEYDFGVDEETTKRVSHILNEACHVFYYHKDGNWQTLYKERFAADLAEELKKKPELESRIIRSGDRVVKMLVFRAIEILRGVGEA